jgi:hypothetical protein
MAIALDAVSAIQISTGAVKTFNFTISGDDRILFVGIRSNSNSATFGVTYNGVAMTEVDRVSFNSNCNRMWLFMLVNPASGTNNVVVTPSSTVEAFRCATVSYTGARQTDQPDSSNNESQSASTTHDISTTVVTDDSWAIAVFGTGAGQTLSAGTGTTKRTTESMFFAIGDSNGTLEAGSRTLEMTSNSDTSGMIIASFAPGGSGPSNLKTINDLAKASVKTVNDLAIANVKTINGLQ